MACRRRRRQISRPFPTWCRSDRPKGGAYRRTAGHCPPQDWNLGWMCLACGAKAGRYRPGVLDVQLGGEGAERVASSHLEFPQHRGRRRFGLGNRQEFPHAEPEDQRHCSFEGRICSPWASAVDGRPSWRNRGGCRRRPDEGPVSSRIPCGNTSGAKLPTSYQCDRVQGWSQSVCTSPKGHSFRAASMRGLSPVAHGDLWAARGRASRGGEVLAFADDVRDRARWS